MDVGQVFRFPVVAQNPALPHCLCSAGSQPGSGQEVIPNSSPSPATTLA